MRRVCIAILSVVSMGLIGCGGGNQTTPSQPPAQVGKVKDGQGKQVPVGKGKMLEEPK